MPALAQSERLALCDLLDELGPGAPTLCAGWQTAELAAHLVVRDRNPVAIAGAIAPRGPLAAYAEKATHRQRDTVAFPELVSMLRAGPPWFGPFALPGPREWFNVHEFFIHHEDVRRPAGHGPRSLGADLDEALWRRLKRLAPGLVRAPAGIGVELVRPDGATVRAGRGEAQVRVSGPIGELVLYTFGRRTAAAVQVSGDPAAVIRLQG
ncbi:MAG: TIGR03085 family metal-binding protein [Mycobacteriales bacterium]